MLLTGIKNEFLVLVGVTNRYLKKSLVPVGNTNQN